MKRLLLILAFLLTASATYAADPPWFYTDWLYRARVQCTNPIPGYVMSESQLVIYYNDDTQTGDGELDCAGLCQTDFGDIIVTEADGETVADFWLSNYVEGTSVTVTTHGNGNKLVYFGNASANVSTNLNSPEQSGVSLGVALHGFNTPAGIVSGDNCYFAWLDAGFSPWVSGYNINTGAFIDANKVAPSALSDMHAAPAMYYKNSRFHIAWGSHNSNLYYSRTVADGTVPPAYSDPDEDLAVYTETDPNSRITTTATSITGTGLKRNETAYVYRDFGVGYFGGDFEIDFNSVYTTADNSSIIDFAITNDVKNTAAIITDDNDAIIVRQGKDGSGNRTVYLIQVIAGELTYDSYAGDGVYFKLSRDETAGFIYLYIYTTAARTTLVDTLSVALGENENFRYLMPLVTYNSGEDITASVLVDGLFLVDPYQADWSREVVISTTGTYPKFVDDGTNLWLFHRIGGGAFATNAYKKSSDNGATWGTATVFIDSGTHPYPYVTDVCKDANNNIYVTFEYMSVSGQDQFYYNVHVMKWDTAQARWEDMAGNALTIPLSEADADTYTRVFTHTSKTYSFHWPRIIVDSANNPAVIFQEIDNTNQRMWFQRWNGSSWESAVQVIADIVDGYPFRETPGGLPYDDIDYIYSELFHISGSGSSAVYHIYTSGFENSPYTGGRKYVSSDGGATWSNSAYTASDEKVVAMAPIHNGSAATSQIIAVTTKNPSLFPVVPKLFPFDFGTEVLTSRLTAFEDLFDREKTGLQLDTDDPYFQIYSQNAGANEYASVSAGQLVFPAQSAGAEADIWTAARTDVSTWEGYRLHFDIPSLQAQNSYTNVTFGTRASGGYTTEATHLPTNGLWIRLHTSGTRLDFSAVIAGTEVINDDDNVITTTDFDVYVLKDAGGDQITIKSNSGADTIYTGTIPASGHLSDEISPFLGSYAVGGTCSAVIFDNISFSEWGSPSPSWGTFGAIEGQDDVPPTISITGPTSAATYTDDGYNTITISGSAADNVGVTSVTYVCDNCTETSGTATGTTSWSQVFHLAEGSNVMTVTAHDASNTAADTITVTYAPRTTGRAWYVDCDAGTDGDGTSGSPFNVVSSLLAAEVMPPDAVWFLGTCGAIDLSTMTTAGAFDVKFKKDATSTGFTGNGSATILGVAGSKRIFIMR